MSRAIAVLLGTLALTACSSEVANKPANDPSTTSVTSAPSNSKHQVKAADPDEQREEDGNELRN